MNYKLSKKTKTFLSIATAIVTSTAVTTILTSCSFSNKINDVGGFDKEYGINDATYTRMEEDFEELYKSQLEQRKQSGEINDDTYDSNLYAFQNKLNSLHTSLYSGENKTLSYTIKTNVLRDYARDNYGIRLSRQSNVILNEAISDIKSSIRGSVLLMCKEYGIADTSEYYKNVETEFERLEKEAKAKYGDTDVVSIIQYIQSGMTACFKGICEQLDCLATQQQLKRFLEKYSINVKEEVADDYCWDKLFSKYGDGNREISAKDFNNIFEISCEEPDPQNVYGSYVLASKKTIEFTNDMIPGYILKPILIKMNNDPYTNTYSVDVDYTLVKTDYIKKENVAQLTAHSSALKNKSFYEDENKSIFDLNASDEEREYTNYVLPITKEYEEQQINATYFNNEDFKFSWSTSEEYGYDDFWTEANENGEYKGKLDISGLATTGMMINGVLLSDILNQAGKISLSGGSDSLSGKAKTKGEDAKQWKLIVDGNEIKNEDISWKLVSATTDDNLPNSIKINDGVVSWTDQIEAGIYSFYVLANYKETKIQTPLITLNISSKDTKNIENFNHNIKNTLFDENTIDQKLLDFVNNVGFSLDYTENDYDTDKEGKKGEINVDDFTIDYKNSKNTFKASNAINEAISSAINNDSGITKRTSNNFWENIKASYDNLVSSLDVKGLKESINSIHDTISSTAQTFYIIQVTFAAFITASCVALFILKAIASRKNRYDFIRFMSVVCLIFVLAIIGSIIAIFVRMDKPNEELYDKLDKFDPKKQSSCIIIKNINTDEKYFKNETGKTEFCKLPVAEMRNKETYYKSGYKSRTNDVLAAETESDLDEYLGGKNATEKIIKDLKDVLDSFKLLYLLVALSSLLSIFLIYLLSCMGSKTYSNYLRYLDQRNKDNIDRQNNWLNKNGFLQKLAFSYEAIQTKWGLFCTSLFRGDVIL